MRRALGTVLLIVVAGAGIVLAVANRQIVPLHLDPFRAAQHTVEAPLYLLLIAALGIGIVLGGLASGSRRASLHEPRTVMRKPRRTRLAR
ncbi:LapA family protein [Acuticoccus sp.]|uniref:LapA family protein n=1 Tax=Acuticoccus sp. TaxID=1904378 RepID=UPI003B51D924